MCLMDMAIQYRAYWRPLQGLRASVSGVGSVIPRSPIRLALHSSDTLGNPLAVYIAEGSANPSINVYLMAGTTTSQTMPIITLDMCPAAFSRELWVVNAPGSCNIMELVLDDATSAAVQRVADEIGR